MLIEPNSTIILLSGVPIDPSYENTVYFENTTQQYAYFAGTGSSFGKTVLEDYSYLRKTRNQIKVEMPVLTARLYNYMMFRNISFEGKWFYAFITEIEYINNVTALITYSIDLIQTWLCDYDFNQCVIEREHTKTDNIGNHIIDEGLDTGEYVYRNNNWYGADPVIVVARTVTWDNSTQKYVAVAGSVNDGREAVSATTEGDYYKAVNFIIAYPDQAGDPSDPQPGTVAALNRIIENMTNRNKIDGIVSMFMADKRAFVNDPNTGKPYGFTRISVSQPKINNDYYIGTHKVRNKKLMCYPYNFIQVSNLVGDVVDYKWEFFTSAPDTVYFDRWGNISLNPGVILYPLNYKGLAENMEEIVTLNNFPQCSYNNDTYKAWLAQNRGMLTAGAIGAVASTAMGISNIAGGSGMVSTATNYANAGLMNTANASRATLMGTAQQASGIGQLMGGLGGAMAILGKVYDHSTLPPTQHGSGNGDLMYQARNCGFLVSNKTITKDYADKIDAFFTMYGYKVNRVGLPELHNRACYTYVKTVGCNIKPKAQQGFFEVPADDTIKIEAIYDKGIRFWDKSATFGSFDWDVNNNIPINLGGA